MSAGHARATVTIDLPSRLLGIHEGDPSGPTVVVTGALHGNEPSGVEVVSAVLDRLRSSKIPFNGRLVAAIGNLRALSRGHRYIDRDLNRRWVPEAVDRLRRRPKAALENEDREQCELLELFAPLLDRATQPVVFIDLHSTSGLGAPFACMADVIRNRSVAFALDVPIVLGLEETIEGSMLGYLCDLGHVGVAVEGGQHDDPNTRTHHEAALWSALGACGAIDVRRVPRYRDLQNSLRGAVRGLPKVIEIRHRHVCADDDGFVMSPGFTNFQPVVANQVVAHDHNGDIATPEAGLMMLPRYQGQGEDGYFLARRVRPVWLSLSARLRRLGADRVLSGLPGVSPHPDRPDHFLVNPRVARFKVVEVFHLLGFRRAQSEDDQMVFSRRRPDALGPRPLPPLEESAPA